MSDRISQYVTLPADTRRLLFDMTSDSAESCGAYYDVLNVEIDNTIVGTVDVCRGLAPGLRSVDVTAFARRRVRISFYLTTDSSVGSEVRIDNVALSSTASAVNVARVTLSAIKPNADMSGMLKR